MVNPKNIVCWLQSRTECFESCEKVNPQSIILKTNFNEIVDAASSKQVNFKDSHYNLNLQLMNVIILIKLQRYRIKTKA